MDIAWDRVADSTIAPYLAFVAGNMELSITTNGWSMTFHENRGM
jgi:hypothetical protein